MFHFQLPWFKKPRNFQGCIRGIEICYTVNGWWVVGNVSSDSLSNYEIKDIYSPDKFGLFYECLIQNKTYQFKSEKCSGGKLSKIHISSIVVGDKLPIFIIRSAKKPQCFKNVKFVPCHYRNQQKSWMDGALFEEYIREMDKKLVSFLKKEKLL